MNRPRIERARTSSGVPRGFFITFEGIEGSGKSSHARLLADALAGRGYRVFLTREPGGTPLGEVLRDVVLKTATEPLVAEAELFVILAARAQHVQSRILPRLDKGDVVVSDRYSDASLAYQGGGRGLGIETVAAADRIATGGISPDLTVLCDIPVEDALDRVRVRESEGGEANRFDRESVDFHLAVRGTYLELAAREPERFLVVDTAGAREEVAAAVLAVVEPRLAWARGEGALVDIS